MEQGLMWLPLLGLFIALAWAGWNEYQKVEAYRQWAKGSDRAKYDIYAMLCQRGSVLMWGKPTRHGPLALHSLHCHQIITVALQLDQHSWTTADLAALNAPDLPPAKTILLTLHYRTAQPSPLKTEVAGRKSGLTAPELTAPELPAPELPAPELPAPDLTKPELPAPDLTKPDLTKPELPAPDLTKPVQPTSNVPALKEPESERCDRAPDSTVAVPPSALSSVAIPFTDVALALQWAQWLQQDLHLGEGHPRLHPPESPSP